MPELSFTTAGRPNTLLRKSEGDRFFDVEDDSSVFSPSGAAGGAVLSIGSAIVQYLRYPIMFRLQ